MKREPTPTDFARYQLALEPKRQAMLALGHKLEELVAFCHDDEEPQLVTARHAAEALVDVPDVLAKIRNAAAPGVLRLVVMLAGETFIYAVR